MNGNFVNKGNSNFKKDHLLLVEKRKGVLPDQTSKSFHNNAKESLLKMKTGSK